MKPLEKTEERIKLARPHVTTGHGIDKLTLKDAFAAMDKTIRTRKTRPAGIILPSKAMRLAAAALIIVAVGLLMFDRNPTEQQQEQAVGAAQSPAAMLKAISLNLAYRRGGIEAVDDQSRRAFDMLESKPAKATIWELHSELNGV